ncbi:ATP-grasp domain-containing protein, partial [Escherichia coli]|nr:ATP-grasp domain-containing protein [Escherichia coli]
ITLLTVSAVDGVHFCAPVGHRQEDGDYCESWQPQQMSPLALEPWLNNGELDWREGAEKSLDSNVIASFEQPFSHHGGTKVL